MPSKNHGRKSAHAGAFSTPLQLLLVETSYISPEPKRCVERKVLNVWRIVYQNLRPLWAEILKKLRRRIQGFASSSVGRTDLASTPYCTVRAVILRGKSRHRRKSILASGGSLEKFGAVINAPRTRFVG